MTGEDKPPSFPLTPTKDTLYCVCVCCVCVCVHVCVREGVYNYYTGCWRRSYQVALQRKVISYGPNINICLKVCLYRTDNVGLLPHVEDPLPQTASINTDTAQSLKL